MDANQSSQTELFVIIKRENESESKGGVGEIHKRQITNSESLIYAANETEKERKREL